MDETNLTELRRLALCNVGPRAGAIMEQAADELTRLRAALDAATARISTLTDVIRDQNDTIKSWEDEDIRCKAALDAVTKWRPMDTAPKGEDIWARPHFLARRCGTITICWWEDDRFSKRPRPYWGGYHARNDVAGAREVQPDGWLPFPATDDGATRDAARAGEPAS